MLENYLYKKNAWQCHMIIHDAMEWKWSTRILPNWREFICHDFDFTWAGLKKVWDKVKRHGLALSFTNHKSFIIEKRSMSCSLCILEIPLIVDSTTSSSLIYW